MRGLVNKFTVICNVCFWLTIVFKYWKPARYIQQDLLSSIIVLGHVAVIANAIWLGRMVWENSNKRKKLENAQPSQPKMWFSGLTLFNVLSLVSQIVHLVLFYW